MHAKDLRTLRKMRGLSQVDMARLLEVSQPLLSQMERGKRSVTAGVVEQVVEKLQAGPTVLDADTSKTHTESELASELGALEYPGFAYLKGAKRNPAEVLFDALNRSDLDMRVVEALPWLPLRYPDLDWEWLNREVKLRNRQNRLGFVVSLSERVAKKQAKYHVALHLSPALKELEEARLAKNDTLCQESWPPSQRAFVHKKRSPLARHWKLDTRLTEADLVHYSA